MKKTIYIYNGVDVTWLIMNGYNPYSYRSDMLEIKAIEVTV